MTQYVCFLRGINVGGRTVLMADLQDCFRELGFSQVSTLLQSGNVVFSSQETDVAALKTTIEAGLTSAFSYPAKLQVLRVAQLSTIVENFPWPSKADHHSYVVFLENNLEADFMSEEIALGTGELLAPGDGVIYWQTPRGLTLSSAVGKMLTKAHYRDFNTNRNINTLQKVIALAQING